MLTPRKKAIIALIVLAALFICFSTIVFSYADHPTVSAKAAFLYEPVTKSSIYEKNADIRLPMASTTKIVTALVTLENRNLSDAVQVRDEALGIEGSSIYLKKGEILTVNDLLIALMLRSANDAAAALAYEIGGSIEGFAELMNEKAASLGLTDTHFTNPHGLDDEAHYTTARELAKISAAAMENSDFKRIVSTKKATITNSAGETRLIVNHNKLLSLCDEAIGIKTGFTKKSGRCLVGAAEKDGITLIAVTIGAPDDWNDHTALFKYGFSLLSNTEIIKSGDFLYKIPVIGTESTVTVHNTQAFSYILNENSAKIKTTVLLPHYVIAPITEGDKLGEIVITLNEKEIGRIPLVASKSINTYKRK
jgi:D-alanyl-D-alanine carboxypeptidase